jgi:hypothetical protein
MHIRESSGPVGGVKEVSRDATTPSRVAREPGRAKGPARITKEDLKRRMDAHEPIAVLDTRSEGAWSKSDLQIPGAIRVPPDDVARHLSEIPRDRIVVPYCT